VVLVRYRWSSRIRLGGGLAGTAGRRWRLAGGWVAGWRRLEVVAVVDWAEAAASMGGGAAGWAAAWRHGRRGCGMMTEHPRQSMTCSDSAGSTTASASIASATNRSDKAFVGVWGTKCSPSGGCGLARQRRYLRSYYDRSRANQMHELMRTGSAGARRSRRSRIDSGSR